MNWRRPVITALLALTQSRTIHALSFMRSIERSGVRQLKEMLEEKLSRLLRHAAAHVPYYRDNLMLGNILATHEPVEQVLLRMPVLTKELVKKHFRELRSDDADVRRPFLNHSGGSSGIPMTFLQDKQYSDWNIANTIYYKTFAGQDIGQKELRIWGSERDLLLGKEKFSVRLRNWLYGRKEANAFRMSRADQEMMLDLLNAYRPSWVEAYVDAAYELALFMKSRTRSVVPPKGILVSAGTLYPFMREAIADAFKAPVFNRYGSREVGGIACSCESSTDLHVSVWNVFLEIVDDAYQPLPPGEAGRVLVTTLNNLSMPLIRYDIGDYASWSTEADCRCGRSTPRLRRVEGRGMAVFRTRDGRVVPAEFFIHLIGVVYNRGDIEKFQVQQHAFDRIEILVVIKSPTAPIPLKADIEAAIEKAMGGPCRIDWTITKDIPPLPNGKYLYTLSTV